VIRLPDVGGEQHITDIDENAADCSRHPHLPSFCLNTTSSRMPTTPPNQPPSN
jgi:hypothetical protein